MKGSIIAYSNEIKEKQLKIPTNTLKKHGAVSSEVALLMAKNIRKFFQTDIGVGITGIAGPNGGTKKKPVGLVYIAVAQKDEAICLKCQFEGSRLQIKSQATIESIKLLLEFLST